MPQEFQVLQCYQCDSFQVHQVKKTTKWQCKLCGEKQSLKKVYGRGSGKDCRCHVQKLNTMRGECTASVACLQSDDMNKTAASSENIHDRWNNQSQMVSHQSEGTKWNMFVDTANNDSHSDDEPHADSMYTTDASVFQHGKKRKRFNKQSDNSDDNQRRGNGTTKNWLNESVSSKKLYKANEYDYGYVFKESTSQSKAFSECADFDTVNEPYANEEYGTSSFVQVTENDSPCAKRKYNKIDREVSTALSSKWSSYVTPGENNKLSTSDDSLGDNAHNQVHEGMFTNKYNTYIEDIEEIENNCDSGLLSNHIQENVRPLNSAHANEGAISDKGDIKNTTVGSNSLKHKFVTSAKPANLGQSKSKWSSYLNCKPQSVGSSQCVPFEPNSCDSNQPLKFSVDDLAEEDFDL